MIERIYQAFLNSSGVCTDSRKINKGSIFFALKGPSFNANTFALQALQMGAAFAVVDEDLGGNDARLIKVNDVLTTLQKLATHHRNTMHIPVIALTGSNGKTTTKELTAAVLKTKYNVLFTEGNLNNHIGVPLTLLKLSRHHNIAVIEMGANHQGEIDMLCKIANPTHGLITNVGKAHLEGFGGFEGVIKGKTELYHFLKNKKGTIFCNSANKFLAPFCKDYSNVVFYGDSGNNLVTGEVLEVNPFLSINWFFNQNRESKNHAATQLTGGYNFENVLGAIAIGKYFGIADDLINISIKNYVPTNQRSQVVVKKSNTIIIDAYNANPTSMSVAIKNLDENYSGNKILILGEMLELGQHEIDEHKNVLSQILNLNFKNVFLVGKRFAMVDTNNMAMHFADSSIAADYIKTLNIQNSTILIKGSRGSKMEKVFEVL